MLLGLVRAPLYAPALASALPAAHRRGGARAASRRWSGWRSALAAARGRRRWPQGMHFSVVCAEDVPRLAAAPATAGRRLRRRPCADCTARSAPTGRAARCRRRSTRVPPAPVATLVLSGGIDPATPPRHGERVAQALGREGAARGGAQRRPRRAGAAAACATWCSASSTRPSDDAGAAGRRRLRARHPAPAGVRAAGRRGARHDRGAAARASASCRAAAARRARVQAVDGVELGGRRRLHHRPAGPQRRRQDDDAAHRRRR